MKTHLNKTAFLFIIVVVIDIFLIGSGLFFWYKINMSTNKISSLRKEIETSEMQKTHSSETLNFLKKEIEPAHQKIDQYLIDEYNYVEFLESVENLGEQARVDVEIRSNKSQNDLRLDIACNGAFNNVMYFAALIESLPINLTTKSVLVEKKEKTAQWQGMIVIDLPGLGSGIK
ncbi:hypothetical protein KKA89_03765 [Patescibacteria group bacterium]|nr:hypothetical protein [Patescibacteria group bacterium]MBU2417068.1 hypothetical protein [Patescibacteria group bacterium]